MKKIDQKYLKECLKYCPLTGSFEWNKRPESHFKNKAAFITWTKRFYKKTPGCKWKSPNREVTYYRIKIKARIYPAHILAWLYVHGVYPSLQIDHIDGDGLNNKLNNLRDVSHSVNQRNTVIRKTNTSGIQGVQWESDRRRWTAKIHINGVQIRLGSFIDKSEAIRVRKEAEKEHGYSPAHGRPKQ